MTAAAGDQLHNSAEHGLTARDGIPASLSRETGAFCPTWGDPDKVAIAETIITRRTGTYDPATFRDRHQDVLKALIEAKLKGRTIAAPPVVTPSPVIDLMAAQKRSLGDGRRGFLPLVSAARRRRASPWHQRQTPAKRPSASGPKQPHITIRQRLAR
jgi:hypothetical protein